MIETEGTGRTRRPQFAPAAVGYEAEVHGWMARMLRLPVAQANWLKDLWFPKHEPGEDGMALFKALDDTQRREFERDLIIAEKKAVLVVTPETTDHPLDAEIAALELAIKVLQREILVLKARKAIP